MIEMAGTIAAAPSINLAADLLKCLSHLEPADSTKAFALFETQHNPPNPGICLRNGGSIGLPLSDGDAQVFKAASYPASLERDHAVYTWIIPAGEFEIQNPAWGPFLQGVVTKVSAGLGVDSTGKGVSAELFSLSLHDAGSRSTPVRRSPPNPQAFGTLAITLPSKHVGGEVCISHADTRVFEPAQSSAFDASYTAWFSDVTHEVKPVLAGRRLVLTYCLVHSTLGPDVLAAGSNKSMAKLDMLFSYWRENIEEETSMLAHLLKDEVDDENLSYSGLEGNNLQVITYLRQAAEKYDFCIYLAKMRRVINGEDYDYDDVYERELDQSEAESILECVVGLDGTEVAKNMEFGDEMLIQEEPFEGVEPDDEEYSGTAVYFRTVVLFMPKQYQINHFMTPSFPQAVKNYWGGTKIKGTRYAPDVIGWIERLSASFKQSGDSGDRKDLEEICKIVTDAMRDWKLKEERGSKTPQPFSAADIARVVAASVDLDNKNLFKETFDMCPYKVPASNFKFIGAGLLRYGLNSLLPKLSLHVSAFSELSDRLDIINAVQDGVAEEVLRLGIGDATSYQAWAYEEAERSISATEVTISSTRDGFALANYCQKLPPIDVFDKVLPAVKRNISFTPMILAFENAIFTAGIEERVPHDIARAIFADIILAMLNGFGLLVLDTLVTPLRPTIGYESHSSFYRQPDPVLDARRCRDIALVLCHCQSLDLTTELNLLVSNLVEEARTTNLVRFDLMFLPFLKVLGSTIQELSIAVQMSPLQSLFQKVLSIYLERYVQPEPQRSIDWSRPTVICDCQDCPFLNKFLADPKRRTHRFTINGKRRDHVFSKVADTGIDHAIERMGSCYSLVLSKNDKYFEVMHKAWEDRCTVAKNQLRAIDAEVGLKPFLADLYDPIFSMSMVSGSAAREYRQLPPPHPASGDTQMHVQVITQPLAPISNNVQGARQLPTLSSVIAQQWQPLPPSRSNGKPETWVIPQGAKRKASENLEQESKRRAPEIIVIDD